MIIDRAKRVLQDEAKALAKLTDCIGKEFEIAVKKFLEIEGKVIVVGMGKSGLIGRKIAATFSSTGTPSLFLHAAESLHGDIGVIEKRDVVLILSYSGKTDEIATVLPALRKINIPVISITGDSNSELAKNSDVVLEIKIEKEACPLDLTPTTSTTAMLALGDALAISLLEERGFEPEDFANLHPAGTLGKKLLLKVDDIISKTGVNPIVELTDSVKDALFVMTSSRVGATSVVDETGALVGYFTDGDFRRTIQGDPEIMEKNISEVMTKNPVFLRRNNLAIKAREILKDSEFDNMPVVDSKNRPVGIIDERDIIREGL